MYECMYIRIMMTHLTGILTNHMVHPHQLYSLKAVVTVGDHEHNKHIRGTNRYYSEAIFT